MLSGRSSMTPSRLRARLGPARAGIAQMVVAPLSAVAPPPPALAPTEAALGDVLTLVSPPGDVLTLFEPFIVIVLLASLASALIQARLGAAARAEAADRAKKLSMPRRRRAERDAFQIRTSQALTTINRIGIPTVAASVLGFVLFDNLSVYISTSLPPQTLAILSRDNLSGQYVQNFLLVIDLLFAILAGNAYAELYQQQESIYMALYREVSVAQLLLEQLTLVGQARPWYPEALARMRQYVYDDLRNGPTDDPVAQLAINPRSDPLEAIMRLTSVGVPSVVYDSVKDLRQARGERLGAFQRKFPELGITLLYLLAAIELCSFPLLGAGTAGISEPSELVTVSILDLQSLLFASVSGCLVLVLRIIEELWETSGGVFNVDDVLRTMVLGLEEELEMRSATRPLAPQPQQDAQPTEGGGSSTPSQGASLPGVAAPESTQGRWIMRRLRARRAIWRD